MTPAAWPRAALAALVLCSCVAPTALASASRIPPDVCSVHIQSQGKTLFGRLFSPALDSAASKAPSVLMLHGIPGTEQNFDVAYALRDVGSTASFGTTEGAGAQRARTPSKDCLTTSTPRSGCRPLSFLLFCAQRGQCGARCRTRLCSARHAPLQRPRVVCCMCVSACRLVCTDLLSVLCCGPVHA